MSIEVEVRRCCHVCKYSMMQYPRRHVCCSQCPNIVCERCFGTTRLPDASWMEVKKPYVESRMSNEVQAKKMHDRGSYVCPLCDGSCLCRRCTRYTSTEDEKDALGHEDNHTVAAILGELRESPAKRTSPRHRHQTSQVKRDDVHDLHLERSLEDAAAAIRMRAVPRRSGRFLSDEKNRSTKVSKTSKASVEISLDEGVLCSQDSSLDAHASGSELDEIDSGTEVSKVALLELKLEYKDLTERVERSLQRIEEGRKCMTTFVDHYRNIVSRMSTWTEGALRLYMNIQYASLLVKEKNKNKESTPAH
ncbi:hypothetical protein PROFUN_01160 [Planoprotostelium fungivorum]|uniref:Uncharacterized protein n=1 Tax=Planoprotostelium fungivorum TaxID=1890364 RepID=A0A2P6NCJ2_9EUKA|nr:hypothetical protein PROFUN_01160 [Planoprotostelium fungivorum]